MKTPHTSYPNNPLISEILYLADYIQKAGSGTLEMIKQCRKSGLPEPEFLNAHGEFRTIIVRDIFTESALNKLGLNERQFKAVKYVKDKGQISNKEYRKLCKITDRTALRDLSDLCDKQLFEKIGITGRKTEYTLTRHKPDKPDKLSTKISQTDKKGE